MTTSGRITSAAGSSVGIAGSSTGRDAIAAA
jgi:hypothetical protein